MKKTNAQFPYSRDLVLVGGGHTHALVLRMWGMNPLAGVRLTVINPDPTAAYSGMLPGFVAGHYDRDALDIDLVKLARFAGARLIAGAATAIDPVARTVTVPGRPPIAYDVASVDVGITSIMPSLPGIVPAKPLGPFAERWAAYRANAQDPKVAVIGAGAAGVELVLAMTHALRSDGHKPQAHLIDAAEAVAGIGPVAQKLLRAELAKAGVEVVEHATVATVEAAAVVLADGRRIPADITIGAAGARPHDWLAQTGLDLHEGYLTVGPTLQTSDPAIFAVGDCAHMQHAPRPKAGVYAVRQAPILYENLRAALSGGALQSYRPQRDYLKLLSLGGKSALAEKLGTARKGRLLWLWKDRIDRSFMEKLRNLPAMEAPEIPLTAAKGMREAMGDKPMCGGCGAKVGRGALREALATVPHMLRADVQSLPGDDAAVLLTGGQTQVLTTDHLRAFVADPVVMTRIAAVHALGDIWAMGAAPQAATANLILPRMSAELQRRTLAEIMTAAGEVFTAAGATIVGGHSSLGDEFTVGFSVTGLCDAAPITLAGARPGDALILTKPVGSGTIMAAEMAGLARGADVLACLALMQMPQAEAARILADAHAMTDVTGFGLVGHLGGICEASGVGAEIACADVPIMQGALDLAEAGIRSSLYADNRAGSGEVVGAEGALGALMFDPQTAGGLLAAVDPAKAEASLQALRAAGYRAARIGVIVEGPPQVIAQ